MRKKVFANRRGNPPTTLLLRCLRDGTLDVCLGSGKVYSYAKGARAEIKLRGDSDGYLVFTLSREVSGSLVRKTVSETRKGGKRVQRRRWRQEVRVHRAVKMKAAAVDKAIAAGNPGSWREFLDDIPPRVDVDHIDFNKKNNAASNLAFLHESVNRGRKYAAIKEEENF